MAKEVREKKPVEVTTDSHDCLEGDIRCRAYEVFEARGCEHGHDLDDWLNAEAEIIETTAKAAAKAA